MKWLALIARSQNLPSHIYCGIYMYIYFQISLLQNTSVFVCVCLLPTMVNITSIELAERRNKNSVNLTFVTKTTQQIGKRKI